MAFEIKGRYGEQREYSDDADIADVVNHLIWQLETELHGEPDDEHTQIAVSNGDWSLTVDVMGLFTLGDLSWITGHKHNQPFMELHKRVLSREQASDLLQKMARGDIDAVRQGDWLTWDQLRPSEGHCFRNSVPMPVLPDSVQRIAGDNEHSEDRIRKHAVTAQRFAERVLLARDAAIDQLTLCDPDLAALLRSSPVFAGFEGSLLRFTLLQVAATAECEELTLMFDWIKIHSLTDRELVAELIDYVRARTRAEEFTVNNEENPSDDEKQES